ncbi:MAG: hypothetical protein QNJ40_07350 [Xanthomonadales bacterium]|nr:hypothetical protein [Xanthomonadales bacterium]
MINRYCGSLASGLLIAALAVGVAVLATYSEAGSPGSYAQASERPLLNVPR